MAETTDELAALRARLRLLVDRDRAYDEVRAEMRKRCPACGAVTEPQDPAFVRVLRRCTRCLWRIYDGEHLRDALDRADWLARRA